MSCCLESVRAILPIMKWGIFRSEIDPNEELADRLAAARSPYADAWKKFDRLEQVASRGGPYQRFFRIFEWFLFGGAGLFGIKVWRHHTATAAIAFMAVFVLDYLFASRMKNRYRDWPCPRCHAVWPGTKTEKDPACKVCGLRLHQMSP